MAAKRRRSGKPPERNPRRDNDTLSHGVLPSRAPIAILAGLILLSFADVVTGFRGLWASDLFAYHLPLKQIFASIVAEGTFPSWNPYLSGGQPLAANPAFQTFYPPNWLVLLPPFDYWFQVHIILHVIAAGAGMYLLAKSLGLSRNVALLGAIAFSLGAPYLSLLVRLPLLFSLTWLPWVLVSLKWFLQERSICSFAATATFFALQAVLGEPTLFVQSVALAVMLTLWRSARAETGRNLLLLVASITVAVFLAAVQLLPAIDHARDSVRGDGFAWEISSNWSMPFSRLLEVMFPAMFRLIPGDAGQHALSGMYPFRIDAYISEIYLGVLPAVLILAGLLTWKKEARWTFAAALPFVVVALGSYTPLWRVLYDAGLVRSIRYPEKFILGALFVLLIGALLLLQQILDGDRALRRTSVVISSGWLLAGLLLSFSGVSPDSAIGPEVRPLDRTWYGLFVLLRGAALIGILWTVRHQGRMRWMAAAVLLVALDSAFVHTRTASRMPRSFFTAPSLAQELSEEKESYRIFHGAYWDDWLGDPAAEPHFLGGDNAWALRNGMFGYRSATWGFYSVFDDDIDQTGLKESEELRAAVVEARRMTGIWPASVLHGANVRYMINFLPGASRGAPAAERVPVFATDLGTAARHFFAREVRPPLSRTELVDAMTRGELSARTAYTNADVENPASGKVTAVSERPSRIELDVEAEGTAFLVSSVTSHKYWKATLDGTPVSLHRANTAFQGLIVPAGNHTIVMKYRNPLIFIGALISLATLALLAGAVLFDWRRMQRS